jgi:small neutral amino acid transporter SnatA (MarC family)
MLSTFARLLLAFAALSPVALTWVIVDYGRRGFSQDQIAILLAALALAAICYWILILAERRLTRISFSVEEVKAVDNEVVGYIVTYLFPLIAPAGSINGASLLFVLLVLAFVLSAAHAFTFNPLLTIFGYHFYEVKCRTGVSYLLISKSDITDIKQIATVSRISNYLVLDQTRSR